MFRKFFVKLNAPQTYNFYLHFQNTFYLFHAMGKAFKNEFLQLKNPFYVNLQI
jgi:hypothetical protein